MKVQKVCEQCGKTYTARVTLKRPTERSKYCSRACSNRAKAAANIKGDLVKECEICGKVFTTTRHHGGNKTCSKECANKLKTAWIKDKPSGKVKGICDSCGKEFYTWPCRIGRYCSRKCIRADATNRQTGTFRSSTIITCDHCGKEIRKPNSRINRYGNQFCDASCYHAFNGRSSIEQQIAEWLTDQNLKFEEQVKLGRFTIDFLCNGFYIEAHGCYWHGCIFHCSKLDSITVQRRIDRDTRLHQYCEARNIPLVIIWEHDVVAGNFLALSCIAFPPI